MTHIYKSHIEEYFIVVSQYCNQQIINMHFTFTGVLATAKLDNSVFSDGVLYLLMALNVGVKKTKLLAQQTELSPSTLHHFQIILLPNKIKLIFLNPLKSQVVMCVQ